MTGGTRVVTYESGEKESEGQQGEQTVGDMHLEPAEESLESGSTLSYDTAHLDRNGGAVTEF